MLVFKEVADCRRWPNQPPRGCRRRRRGKTVTLLGLTLPGGAELAAEVDAVGVEADSSLVEAAADIAEVSRLNTESQDQQGRTMRTAAPAPMPINRLRRRRV